MGSRAFVEKLSNEKKTIVFLVTKKSVKKMTVSKGVEKKNLDEFDVTDGKERGMEEIKEEKELDDLLGGPQLNPYGTLSKDVFTSIF